MKKSKIINNVIYFIHHNYLDLSTSSSLGIIGKLKRKVISLLYLIIVKTGNPLVELKLAGYPFFVPFSHNLPICLKFYPYYTLNLSRLARHVKDKYPDLKFIDIGANIGNSIPALRQKAYFPILCIEGDEDFFNVLQINAKLFPDAQVIKAFLGERASHSKLKIIKKRGTACLMPEGNTKSCVKIRKLDEILLEKNMFSDSKMVKVDTDGFDAMVLRGAQDFLSARKPVIFFEYDPYLLSLHNEDGLSLLEYLKGLGYRGLLIYDNRGEFMLSANLEQSRILQELNLYFSGKAGKSYCDICAFHIEDEDIFGRARNAEVEFFNQQKLQGK